LHSLRLRQSVHPAIGASSRASGKVGAALDRARAQPSTRINIPMVMAIRIMVETSLIARGTAAPRLAV
jgi:hypothetical protein